MSTSTTLFTVWSPEPRSARRPSFWPGARPSLRIIPRWCTCPLLLLALKLLTMLIPSSPSSMTSMRMSILLLSRRYVHLCIDYCLDARFDDWEQVEASLHQSCWWWYYQASSALIQLIVDCITILFEYSTWLFCCFKQKYRIKPLRNMRGVGRVVVLELWCMLRNEYLFVISWRHQRRIRHINRRLVHRDFWSRVWIRCVNRHRRRNKRGALDMSTSTIEHTCWSTHSHWHPEGQKEDCENHCCACAGWYTWLHFWHTRKSPVMGPLQ